MGNKGITVSIMMLLAALMIAGCNSTPKDAQQQEGDSCEIQGTRASTSGTCTMLNTTLRCSFSRPAPQG